MIVGFNVDSIEGSKGEGPGGDMKVNYSPKIETVEEASVGAIDDEVAKIEFNFTVDYISGDSSAAKIEIDGNILWRGDVEEILDEWEENRNLPENIHAPLMNDLYRKCLSQSVGIADTLGLLPPIPTPRVDQ